MSRYAKVAGPPREVLEEEIQRTFKAAGYLTDFETRDWEAVRGRMIAHYLEHIVVDKRERPIKGTSKGEMTKVVFPRLPGPEDWAGQPDPELAEAVWDSITGDLYAQTHPLGKVQKQLNGGHVLCRCKTTSKGMVTYITRKRSLITDDAHSGLSSRLRRAASQLSELSELSIERNPDDREYYAGLNNTFMADLQLDSARRMNRAVTMASENEE